MRFMTQRSQSAQGMPKWNSPVLNPTLRDPIVNPEVLAALIGSDVLPADQGCQDLRVYDRIA
jgi:hypothetical protein